MNSLSKRLIILFAIFCFAFSHYSYCQIDKGTNCRHGKRCRRSRDSGSQGYRNARRYPAAAVISDGQ